MYYHTRISSGTGTGTCRALYLLIIYYFSALGFLVDSWVPGFLVFLAFCWCWCALLLSRMCLCLRLHKYEYEYKSTCQYCDILGWLGWVGLMLRCLLTGLGSGFGSLYACACACACACDRLGRPTWSMFIYMLMYILNLLRCVALALASRYINMITMEAVSSFLFFLYCINSLNHKL